MRVEDANLILSMERQMRNASVAEVGSVRYVYSPSGTCKDHVRSDLCAV